MSAFGGYCDWDGRPVPADRWSELAAHLGVAGPDRSGMIQPAPWLALQAHVLHFDRLSRCEQQPYRFAQGSVLTWDGRLDNREDLLLSLHRDLGPDQSDAALVAAAYARWGIEALPRLIGDWSLAVWDNAQERVILARDFIGNRPLYYRSEQGRLVWATRLEALAASEHAFTSPDDVYLAGSLTNVGNPNESTPFVGVLQLLAGRVLIATRAGITVQRYWTYSPRTLRYRDLNQYADHLRALLIEAVHVRLRATRPVWAHLSGGWDSSTVVCLAHRLIERRCVEAPAVRPISVVANDPEAGEERRLMAAVEQWCGLETTLRAFRCRPLFAELLGYKTIVPARDMLDMEMPAQRAGDHIVLSGTLGDMTMGQEGGALLSLWESFDSGRLIKGLRGFAAYARTTRRPLAKLLYHAARHRFGSDAVNLRRTAARKPRSLRQDAASLDTGVAADLVARAEARPREMPPSSAEFPRIQQRVVDQLYRHADEGDLASPEHHVPVIWRTHPYAHRPLIEFLLAVPMLTLFDPLFARAGMRRALVDILPPAILARRTKVGIVPAAYHRLHQRQADRLKDAPPFTEPIAEWRLIKRGVVEPRVLAEEVHNMRTRGAPSKFLYRCVCLEAWLRSLAMPSAAINALGSPTVIAPHAKDTSVASSDGSVLVVSQSP